MTTTCPYCKVVREELTYIELAENQLLCCRARVDAPTLVKLVLRDRLRQGKVEADGEDQDSRSEPGKEAE